MEISNLSSAWLLIAIVVLVIVTRVVLYYRAKAKRKDESSKRLSDKVSITREQLADISGKQFEAYVNIKPSFDLCSKSIDITQTKEQKHEQNMKKLFCDLNGNKINKPHIAPSGKVPDFTPPKPPPVRIIKGDKVVNQKEVDEYNASSMYVLSNSYAAQDSYSSNTQCSGSSSVDSGGSSSSSSSSSCD